MCAGVHARAQQTVTEIDDIYDFGDTIFYDDPIWVLQEPQQDLHNSQELIDYAKRFLGTRYRGGGTTPAGFDCSGFTGYVYAHFGYKLGRSSRDQSAQFPRVNRRDIKQGDLVYFGGSGGNSYIGHVGIVSRVNGDGTFQFIHSSSSRGVTISNSTEAYYAARLKHFNRPRKTYISEMDSSNPF